MQRSLLLCIAGGSALQWLLQQCFVAAVPLYSPESGEQAERHTNAQLAVEGTPRGKPQVCRGNTGNMQTFCTFGFRLCTAFVNAHAAAVKHQC